MLKNRIIALVLTLITLVALVACSNDMSQDSGTTGTNPAESSNNGSVGGIDEPSDITLEERYKDVKFDGLTITMAARHDADYGAIQKHVLDFLGDGAEDADKVDAAVYLRNLKVSELLEVEIKDLIITKSVEDYHQGLIDMIAGSEDSFDAIFHGGGKTYQLMMDGYLTDIAGSQYIDIEMPWWNTNSIVELNYGAEKIYFLQGDICISETAFANGVYVNKRLFGEYVGDVNTLFQTVIDGGWTLELADTYAKKAYFDVNQNSMVDESDRIGFLTGGWNSDFWCGAGISLLTYDNDGSRYFGALGDANLNTMSWMVKVQNNNEYTYRTKADHPVTAELFAKGNALFMAGQLYYSHQYLRNMEDDYAIMPFPKGDERNEYTAGLGVNTGFSVSVQKASKNVEATCAVLDALALEGHNSVFPLYYEEALKIKYVRDDNDETNYAAQMIDIIHNNAFDDIVYIAGLSTPYVTWFASSSNGDGFASMYESTYEASNERLQEYVTKFGDLE